MANYKITIENIRGEGNIEELFPYKILKNTTEYDPFSYISYDYMVSTSRTAKFDAFIDDYFDDDTFDFINNLTRVGYKKKIDENNGKYDNDITLYNHFYYSTEDDEDEFVRIELDDNTIEHKIGKEIEDKYGEWRTVSSREIITEGVSTLMCRIYELTTDNERLVYSGLIDKRETKFDGTKLSVSLIDMMGLYVELAEKYNMVVNDINDIGGNVISLTQQLKVFVNFLKSNININNDYFSTSNGVVPNYEHIDKFVPYSNAEIKDVSSSNFDYILKHQREPIHSAIPWVKHTIIGYIPITVNIDASALKIELSMTDDNIDSITSNGDIGFSFKDTSIDDDYFGSINLSSIDIYKFKKTDIYDINTRNMSDVTKTSVSKDDVSYAFSVTLKYIYSTQKSGAVMTSKVLISPVLTVAYGDSNRDFLLSKDNLEIISVNNDLEEWRDWSGYDGTMPSNLYVFIKETIRKIGFSEINNRLINTIKNFEAMCFNNIIYYNIKKTASSTELKTISFAEDVDDDYKHLDSIKTYNRVNNVSRFTTTSSILINYITYTTNTYVDSIPLYADTYSLYDITKLFSITCYNKILTKDTGELYFDKESYSENNGYIYIDKSDIINNFSQQSMIGDDEEFEVLDNVYVGTKYIKEAYKRLETSTKENYKILYENNNMKVSFNLRNYIYDIKSNLTTTIDQREIEPKDVIRIMHNGYVKIAVFVTSVKFINNNTEIEIEGITLQTRNITVSHLKSDSK